MNMIGMSIRSAAMRFCRSRPLRPGRETSSTRQLGTSTRGRARNSCADANVSGCQPSERISNSSDSRTDTSSSTTNTIGVACDMDDDLDSWSDALAECIISPSTSMAARSARSKRGIERPEQGRVAEWFVQALHGTIFKQAWTDGLVFVGADEDD